jgi:hypothetical protein
MARVRVRLELNRAVLARAATTEAGRLVLSTTRRTYNRAKILAPVDTGNLRAAHSWTIQYLGGSVRGRVTNRVNYAIPVHEGRGTVVIRPRRRKALRFVIDGQVVFARKVVQPPRPGKPWLLTALVQVAVPQGFTVTPR